MMQTFRLRVKDGFHHHYDEDGQLHEIAPGQVFDSPIDLSTVHLEKFERVENDARSCPSIMSTNRVPTVPKQDQGRVQADAEKRAGERSRLRPEEPKKIGVVEKPQETSNDTSNEYPESNPPPGEELPTSHKRSKKHD